MSLSFAPSRKLAAERLERGGPRVYDPRERLALAAFDGALRIAAPLFGLRPDASRRSITEARRIVALRLDRLGDLITTLPSLQALRTQAPEAHITLAVGSWNEPIARRLPFVDAVRLVDTPWAAWGRNVTWRDAHRALSAEPIDLAIDFQGDVRVNLLMALAGATLRAGYADTGGERLLTHVGTWDESQSWYRQNLSLVQTLFAEATHDLTPVNFVTDADRAAANEVLSGYDPPLIGIQPSAGRAIKQWEDAKFAALIDRLARRGTVILSGSEGDREQVERIHSQTKSKAVTLLGLDLATFSAVVERLNVFVTGDTGPMHVAHSVGTQNVAIFGPSDPVRYGPEPSFERRLVVRHPVYCSPCNMIRRPPKECAEPEAPECISGIRVEAVTDAVLELLSH